MAGFFGLFNYEKEGPGISKNAPKKKTFIVFFETFFRNFWKFIPVNLLYGLLCFPIVTNGLAAAGLTNVTRNIARDKHSFGVSDFFDTIKKNWKQALAAGIFNALITVVLVFDLYFFFKQESGLMHTLSMGIALCVLFIFANMQFYIWTMLITFRFKISQIYRNSFKFVFINLKNNLICFFTLALVYAVNIAILFLLQSVFIHVLFFEILIYLLVFPSFRFLLVQFCTFPAIRKYIIDPYYREHPGEDIERRKDLGLEIEEEMTDEDEEDGEDEESDEEPENVFED